MKLISFQRVKLMAKQKNTMNREKAAKKCQSTCSFNFHYNSATLYSNFSYREKNIIL